MRNSQSILFTKGIISVPVPVCFKSIKKKKKPGALNQWSGRQTSLYAFVPDTSGCVIRLCSWEITAGVQCLRLLSGSVTGIPLETRQEITF